MFMELCCKCKSRGDRGGKGRDELGGTAESQVKKSLIFVQMQKIAFSLNEYKIIAYIGANI
jgi:hypothetical protein